MPRRPTADDAETSVITFCVFYRSTARAQPFYTRFSLRFHLFFFFDFLVFFSKQKRFGLSTHHHTTIVVHMYSSIAMKPCGELLCSAYELCMPHDMQCYPCDSYCDSGSHNFDRHYCQNHCQDFIRDKMQTVGDGVMGFFNVHSLLFTMFCLAIIIFLLVKINKFMEKNDENPEVENGITSIIGDEENNLPCKSDIIV